MSNTSKNPSEQLNKHLDHAQQTDMKPPIGVLKIKGEPVSGATHSVTVISEFNYFNQDLEYPIKTYISKMCGNSESEAIDVHCKLIANLYHCMKSCATEGIIHTGELEPLIVWRKKPNLIEVSEGLGVFSQAISSRFAIIPPAEVERVKEHLSNVDPNSQETI